jgi:hypothetical protein
MEELVRSVGETGGHTVLVTDSVESKGSFVVHCLLAKLLLQTNTRVVLLCLAEPFSHYSRIARKQGCILQQVMQKGRFMFVGLEDTEMRLGESTVASNALAALYLKIRDAVRGKLGGGRARDVDGQTCVIIDDLSVLDVLANGSQKAVLDFVHYCKALTYEKQRCSVVLLTHQDVVEEACDLNVELELEYLSDTVIRVEPLSTGLAADVHGQLTILRRGGLFVQDQLRAAPLPSLQKFQFRILEQNVQFFLPGQL